MARVGAALSAVRSAPAPGLRPGVAGSRSCTGQPTGNPLFKRWGAAKNRRLPCPPAAVTMRVGSRLLESAPCKGVLFISVAAAVGAAPMNRCPSRELLASLLEGVLDPADRPRVEEHVGQCRRCRDAL